jgi:hypothetical protein
VSKIENIKSLQDTMIKSNLDSISKESLKGGFGTSLDLEKKIFGNWELMEYDLSEENEEDQEKPSGVIWIFKSNHTCEERSDPSNPNDVTIYEYKISQKGCEITQDSKKFFYINLTNQTVKGEDNCFMIDIDKDDETNREILRLYAYGAMSPDVLVRK